MSEDCIKTATDEKGECEAKRESLIENLRKRQSRLIQEAAKVGDAISLLENDHRLAHYMEKLRDILYY